MRLSLASVCAVVVVACGSIASRQRVERKGEAGADEVLLTVTPFKDTAAVAVLLRADGESEVVRYSPAQLLVLEVRRGRAPEEALARLRARAGASDFRSALSRGEFGGGGFEDGDLFQLTLGPQGPAASGLLHKTPPVVQEFIKDLLSLEGRLGKARPAEAYLRGERIERRRLDALRRAGKVRLIPLDDFPADLRPALTKAAEQPLRFQPLSRAQYDRLLTFSSHGPELFATAGDAGHQLTLYQARP
ncbi:MAG TPA: hypothetical protein VF611_05370 [Pyrinomonadaceae bacterium]